MSNIRINVWRESVKKIDLNFYEEIINCDFYINILKKYILHIKLLVQNPFIITSCNSLYQSSIETKDWAKNKVKEIIDWPSKSPYLKLIENV